MSVWTPGQSASNQSSGSVASLTVSLGSSVTVGDALIVLVSGLQNSAQGVTFTVTDNNSNPYTLIGGSSAIVYGGSTTNFQTINVFLAIVPSGGGGTGLTLTATPSANAYIDIAVLETAFTGTNITLINQAFASPTSSPAATGNVTVSGTDLVLGCFYQLSTTGTAWTVGSGYTSIHNVDLIGGTQAGALVEYQANVTSGPVSPSATLAGLSSCAAYGVTLRAYTPTTYYASNAGSDSNSGTSTSSPFLTMNHAIAQNLGGDIIALAGGNTFAEYNTDITLPITITSYGSGQATIAPPSGNNTALQFYNCGATTIQNVILVGLSPLSGTPLVYFRFTDNTLYCNITVTECNGSNCNSFVKCDNYYGIDNGGICAVCTNFQFTNNVVNNLVVRDAFGMGGVNSLTTRWWGTIVLTGNYITNILGNTTTTSCYAFTVEAVSGGTIANNYIEGVGADWTTLDGTAPYAIEILSSSNLNVYGNVISTVYTTTNASATSAGIAIDNYSTKCKVYDNVVTGCYGSGIQVWCGGGGTGIVVANNLIVGCGTLAGLNSHTGGISLANALGGTVSVDVFNNTVDMGSAAYPALQIDASTSTAKIIANNIFRTRSSTPSVNIADSSLGSGFTLEQNAYLSGTGFSASKGGTNYTSLAAWRTATGQETSPNGFALSSSPFLGSSGVSGITESNFGLVQQYSLPSGSALLGAGLNISSLYSVTPPSTDLAGKTISAASLSVGAINAALSYTLTGPTTGQQNVASTNFTLTPSANVVDTITLSDGSGGGTFTPSSLSLNGSAAVTFTYTNPSVGAFTLTATSALGTAISGSPANYTTTTAYKWQYVQNVIANNNGVNTTNTVTIGAVNPVRVGDVLVIAATAQTATVSSITDTGGNTYHKIGNQQFFNSNDSELWYCVTTTGGELVVTVTWSSSQYSVIVVTEYSYPPGSTLSVDSTHGNGSSGSAVSVTSLTASGLDLAVMVANQGGSATTPTAGSGWTLRQYSPSGQEQPIVYQDQLNPASSPVSATLTLGASGSWTAVGATLLATLPPFELTGPSCVAVGATATFTLAPTKTLTDTVTIASNIAGALSHTSLTFTASSASQTFTFTPSVPGIATITLSSGHGYAIGASPYALGSYIDFTLTGPLAGGLAGSQAAFTLTPASATADVLTFSDGGAGGTFDNTSLTWTSSGAPQTFHYTPPGAGTQVITVTSADGAPIAGSPFSLSSVATVVAATVTKWGKVLMFIVNGSTGAVNGVYPLAHISAVNSNPTVKVNGNVVQINGPAWNDAAANQVPLGYLLQCGGVASIPMSTVAVVTGTLSASWNGVSGGGTGLTLGTPTTAVGVTSYTINSAGSGLTNGTYLYTGWGWNNNDDFPGNPTGIPATASVTVAGGVVTSCVPYSASPVAVGGGYSGSSPTITGIIPAGDGLGTGASITFNIHTYVTGVPVTAAGSGFTNPPTITVSGASGAVCAPIMTGPLPTDTVTYSAAANWLTTSLGSAAAATNAMVLNSVGQLEGPTANLTGIPATPTFKFGLFPTTAPQFQQAWVTCLANKFTANNGWLKGSGTSALSLDPVTGFPTTWTSGGTINAQITMATFNGTGGTAALPAGTWTVVYDDSNIPDSTVLVSWSGDFTSGSPTTTVSGTTVTQTYNVTHTGLTNTMMITVSVKSALGTWHLSNPGVFPPNCAIDRTYCAIDDNIVAALTGPEGTVPPVFRFMASFGGQSGLNNFVDPSDIPPSTINSFYVWYSTNVPNGNPNQPGGIPSGNVPVAFARFLNTNASSGTYTWSSTKLYSSAPWAVSGSDSFGNYLDMTAGPLGVNDNGRIVSLGGQAKPGQIVVEFRCTSPHGLKTGQRVQFYGTATIPCTQGMGNQTITANENTPFPAFVTGPYTFAISDTGGGHPSGGTSFAQVNSTTEIALSGFTCQLACPLEPGYMPYEAAARYVARFPGASLWLNITPTASHALIQHIMSVVMANLGPTNGLLLEWGNEHWNYYGSAGYEFFWELNVSIFNQYVSSGTPFLTYAHGQNNLTLGANDAIYTLLAADALAVAKAAWTGAGRSASNFYMICGGQQGFNGPTANIVATMNTFGIPNTNVVHVIANYQGIVEGQPSLTKAFSAAGDVAVSSPGNWPVDAILDFTRFFFFYNTYIYGQWSTQFAAMSPGSLMGCYEGSMYEMLDVTNIGLANYLEEDMYNHPAYYDLFYTFGLSMQKGDPLVTGAAPALFTHSGAFVNDPLIVRSQFSSIDTAAIGGNFNFRVNQSPYAATGHGLTNKYFTPQGGSSGADASHRAGYSSNQNPGVQALVDFNAAAGTPPVTFELTGPSTALVGVPSSYALVPSTETTDVITLSDSNGGGTFFPTSINITSSSATQTFSYTPGTAGTKTLTVTSADGSVISGSPLTLVVSGIGYILTGPTSGYVGNAAAYAITPNSATTDTITFSDGGAGGTFSPTSLTFTTSSATQTFSYTPASIGTKTLTVTSTDGGTIIGEPVSLSVSRVNYTLTGPEVGFVGYAIAYALIPSGMPNDTITFSDGGAGGTFYPSSLQITNSALVQTFSYVPGSSGTISLTLTSSDGGTITGSPLSLLVSTSIQKPTKKWFGSLRSQRPKTRFK